MAGPTNETVLTIGKLCVGGDWACAHGDPSGLRYVAQRLAAWLQEPLHCELLELVDICYSDPDRAVVLWPEIRDKLYRASAS